MQEKLSKLKKLIDDKTEELLALEKQRREVEEDDLIFVGMSNLANYEWCGMKSVLKSRDEELKFFKHYLFDRIRYCLELDYYPNEFYHDLENLLRVGKEIHIGDILSLLAQRQLAAEDVSIERKYTIRSNGVGKRVMIINPAIPDVEKQSLRKEAKQKGIEVTDPEKFPLIKERLLESSKAETYPTIRWHQDLEDYYVVVGEPDGIIKDFVYVWATARNKVLYRFVKPVALLKADIYGSFFYKPKKKVQIYISEEDKTRTFKEEVDEDEVYNTLNRFKEAEQGKLPETPEEWKCKTCEFSDSCPIN